MPKFQLAECTPTWKIGQQTTVVHLTVTPRQRYAFSAIVRRGMALGTTFGDRRYHPVGRYLHNEAWRNFPAHTLHLHLRKQGCVTNDAQTILNMFTSLTF